MFSMIYWLWLFWSISY